MKKIVKNTNGITLIALVITIVVLLILAAVSIATLTGENGILTRANEAKTETEEAKEDELRRLTALEAATNLENKEYKDKNEDTVTIPAGFAVSQVEGENTIQDGLVIIDQNRNEFVWIPVENDIEFKRYDGYMIGKMQNEAMEINYAITDFFNKLSEPNSINGYENEDEEYNNMKESVLKYNGFYVARYEASKDEKDSNKPASKQGKEVWNNIIWGNSMSEIGTEGAVSKAKNMYVDKKYGVTSTLIYGIQWDAIMQWIDSEYKNQDGTLYTKNSFVADSTGKGNYAEDENINEWKGKLALTGSRVEYSNKNIYDLAGNVAEWTMESYESDRKIARGGNFYNEGSQFPASQRNYSYPYLSSDQFGFRIALFIN